MEEAGQHVVPSLPRTARMRYWRPAPELAPLVSGYHLYALAPPDGERQRDVFQPAWPSLRFALGAHDWCVRQPGQRWRPVPARSAFGPSSRITWSESGPGLVVGIGLRPRGWSRLARAQAADWADRVGQADDVFAIDIVSLGTELERVTDDAAVPELFDTFLNAHLGPADERDAIVGRMEAALLDPELATVAALAGRVGISPRSLERLSLKAFGFSPKMLLRRARFLRSLHAMAQSPPAGRALAIDLAYTDYSHFVRDAQHFLGMSPQAFLRLDTPLLRQSLILRQVVLGAPAQALAVHDGV
jgi:AraC-like DNA-binding protein